MVDTPASRVQEETLFKPEIDCVVATRSEIGESPFWDVLDGILWWVDILPGLIHRYDPETGENQTVEFGEPVGSVAPRSSGGLVVAAKSGFHFLDPDTGKRNAITDPEADIPENRFNDGITDPKGRFWAGTMRDGNPQGRVGRFYRLDREGRCRSFFDPVFTSNGLAFSPDGRKLYFADSGRSVRTVFSAEYDPDTGVPGAPRVFFDTRSVQGRPDGGTVDADGCYWMAAVEGSQLVRLTPDGRVDRTVEMPVKKPTKPMFGGSRLETLFVTSIGRDGVAGSMAGNLFAVTGLGVTGVAQSRFGG